GLEPCGHLKPRAVVADVGSVMFHSALIVAAVEVDRTDAAFVGVLNPSGCNVREVAQGDVVVAHQISERGRIIPVVVERRTPPRGFTSYGGCHCLFLNRSVESTGPVANRDEVRKVLVLAGLL